MKKFQSTTTAFLLLCWQISSAEPTHSEPLADPTAMTETLNQGLKGLRLPTVGSASIDGKTELSDPTRMNENFRAALERVFKNKTGATSNPTTNLNPLRSALPKISLVASIQGASKEDYHAMLRINDQTRMVSAGDKFNVIDNNQLIEVEVIDIAKNAVKVQLKPSNETLLLR